MMPFDVAVLILIIIRSHHHISKLLIGVEFSLYLLLLELALLNVELLGFFDPHLLQLLALTGQQESLLFLELASFG